MNLREVQSMQKRLTKYVEQFKSSLGRKERSYWCRAYLSGLMLDGQRKSIEPMSKRLPNGNEQALQQFVNQSPWNSAPIQKQLNQLMIEKFAVRKGVLILDDTSLPKKGTHSIGVARQYCGALGKIANCQSIVTWHFATHKIHFPIIGRLYLPKSWTTDVERMKKVGIPAQHQSFRKKWEIALELLQEVQEQFPYECIVFDAGYGEIKEFRTHLSEKNLRYVGQIPESHSFWPENVQLVTTPSKRGRPRKKPSVSDPKKLALSAKQWKERLVKNPKRWKKVSLDQKSGKVIVKAVAIRVKEVITQAYRTPGENLWLIIEKLPGGTFKYYVSNASRTTSLKRLIRWAHQRWKIEQGYQHMKNELGLDHFEGRSWRGLTHHFLLCVMAYCFLLLTQKDYPKKIYSPFLCSEHG
ncbi:MAG: IS701 family transposase [Candidatus Uhrbacteria bacterium]